MIKQIGIGAEGQTVSVLCEVAVQAHLDPVEVGSRFHPPNRGLHRSHRPEGEVPGFRSALPPAGN